MTTPRQLSARQRVHASPEASRKKRVRPPRGLGLRSRAGCIPCRSRHRKCDEVRPFCGDCQKFSRQCQWINASPLEAVLAASAGPVNGSGANDATSTGHIAADAGLTSPGGISTSPESSRNMLRRFSTSTSATSQVVASFNSADNPGIALDSRSEHPQSHWLDVLVDKQQNDFDAYETPSEIESSIKASFPCAEWNLDEVAILAGLGEEQRDHAQEFFMGRWERNEPAAEVSLSSNEVLYFRNFVNKTSRWFDIFDHEQHFAGHVAHLALRDEGLMNAILALAAHHMLHEQSINQLPTTVSADDAVQFYSKALCYVQRAMQYAAYSHSEELLATSLIVSAYEMMNGSMEGWTRHLKGVYWIQRCQKVNSLTPGLRGTVWWSWLRQEQWAAFREKRKSLSYWEPPEPMSTQTPDQLATYIAIILRHAINFAAPRETEQTTSVQYLASRMQTAEKILRDLAIWEDCLGSLARPLSRDASCIGQDVPSSVRETFVPMWIHPPKFAVAMQMSHFARILVYMNRPILNGLGTDLDVRKALRESISTICGISMALEDDSAQIMSSQCLYGAGICEYVEMRQKAILELIGRCERRSGWPTSHLKKGLQTHWLEMS